MILPLMEPRSVEQLLKEKKIFQVINPKLVQTGPETSVKDAIALMQSKRSGYLVISKENKPVGMFTEVDVTNKILNQKINLNDPVSNFMTADPFTLTPQDSIGKAIKLMGDKRFYHIPLVDKKGELSGILSVRTLIRFLSEFYPTEIFNLPPKPDQVMESREGG